MDETKDRQELLLEIEQLKLDSARLRQRMDKMRKWNNSLLQKNWQESEDQTLLEFSEHDSEIPNPQELLQELRIHQEELRVQNEELLEIRYSLEESRSRYQALFRNSPLPCLVLNESSRILELNHKAANLLAQSNPDLHPKRMPMSLFFASIFSRKFSALH